MSILKITSIILAIIVVAGLSVWLFSFIGSSAMKTIKPDVSVTASMIVYDPGFSGATKDAAISMAMI